MKIQLRKRGDGRKELRSQFFSVLSVLRGLRNLFQVIQFEVWGDFHHLHCGPFLSLIYPRSLSTRTNGSEVET